MSGDRVSLHDDGYGDIPPLIKHEVVPWHVSLTIRVRRYPGGAKAHKPPSVAVPI